MKFEDQYILGRSVSPPPAGADAELAALHSENLALTELAQPSGPAPDRGALLHRAAQATSQHKEKTMLYRLFAGRSLAARVAIAASLGLCLVAAAVLLPRINLTGHGPAAGYPAAWAAHESHVLIFDFGNVFDLQPNTTLRFEGPMMTLDMARAITALLRAQVADYSSQKGALPRLGVVEYRIMQSEMVEDYNPDRPSAGTYGSGGSGNHYVAAVVLDNPAEADAILKVVAHTPLLPLGELVDSTWFTQKGLPDLGQPGVTIGVLADPPNGIDATKSPWALTPEQQKALASGQVHVANTPAQDAAFKELMANYKPHYEYFSYPADATPAQIAAQLTQWLNANRKPFKYTVKVSLSGDALNRDVEVEIKGVDRVASGMGNPRPEVQRNDTKPGMARPEAPRASPTQPDGTGQTGSH